MQELSDKEKAAIAKHYNSIVNKSFSVYVLTKSTYIEYQGDFLEVLGVALSEDEAK